jgi:hypothetical protein
MIEPQCSIVIDQVVVSFNVVISLVEAVKGMRALIRRNVEMVVTSVVMGGGASSASITLRPSLSSSTHLMTGARVWGWGGRRGFSRCLVTLAAATIALSLDFGSDRRDEGGGEVGVGKFGGLGDGRVGEEGGGGSEVSKSLDGVVQVTFFRPL